MALESTRTIDIERFVPREDIGWIWLDRPHFLMPADEVGEEAFAVIREAMVATGTVGDVAARALPPRARRGAGAARTAGIVLWTLRYGDEVRPAEDYFAEGGEAGGEADAARHRTDRRAHGAWSERFLDDPVQDRMLEIIAGKKPRRGKAASKPEAAAPTDGNVVSIMDALEAQPRGGQGQARRADTPRRAVRASLPRSTDQRHRLSAAALAARGSPPRGRRLSRPCAPARSRR